ncbi:MAG: helix-turn-helix domain-containing protein [Actinomycetota bacterium]
MGKKQGESTGGSPHMGPDPLNSSYVEHLSYVGLSSAEGGTQTVPVSAIARVVVQLGMETAQASLGPAKTAAELFRENVRRLREQRGWSQETLRQRFLDLGYSIDRATIAKIESKERNRKITVDDLVRFAFALDVALIYLITPWNQDLDLSVTPTIRIPGKGITSWVQGHFPVIYEHDAALINTSAYHWQQPNDVWWGQKRYDVRSVKERADNEEKTEALTSILSEMYKKGPSEEWHENLIQEVRNERERLASLKKV